MSAPDGLLFIPISTVLSLRKAHEAAKGINAKMINFLSDFIFVIFLN
jgi:hypothetical protein